MIGCLGGLLLFAIPIMIAQGDRSLWWLTPGAALLGVLGPMSSFVNTYNIIRAGRVGGGPLGTAATMVLWGSIMYGVVMLVIYGAARGIMAIL